MLLVVVVVVVLVRVTMTLVGAVWCCLVGDTVWCVVLVLVWR